APAGWRWSRTATRGTRDARAPSPAPASWSTAWSGRAASRARPAARLPSFAGEYRPTLSSNQAKATRCASRLGARMEQGRRVTPENRRFSISPPVVELPKGGGAIRGIGEKLSTNPVTGTSSIAVPIVTSPGRGGFGPALSLSYDSGAGN